MFVSLAFRRVNLRYHSGISILIIGQEWTSRRILNLPCRNFSVAKFNYQAVTFNDTCFWSSARSLIVLDQFKYPNLKLGIGGNWYPSLASSEEMKTVASVFEILGIFHIYRCSPTFRSVPIIVCLRFYTALFSSWNPKISFLLPLFLELRSPILFSHSLPLEGSRMVIAIKLWDFASSHWILVQELVLASETLHTMGWGWMSLLSWMFLLTWVIFPAYYGCNFQSHCSKYRMEYLIFWGGIGSGMWLCPLRACFSFHEVLLISPSAMVDQIPQRHQAQL
jgi:hypothetical protein